MPIQLLENLTWESTFLTSGSNNPIYGIISLGSVTKEHMFPTICDALFLVSALRTLNPLCTIGTNNASDGASIEFTKVVCNKWIRLKATQYKT
jgi:hypothetical protein